MIISPVMKGKHLLRFLTLDTIISFFLYTALNKIFF